MTKSFADWYSDSTKKLKDAVNKPEPLDLPEGVDEYTDGTYRVTCCRCDRLCDVTDFIDVIMESPEPYRHYCGGSPGCCP